MKRVIRFENFLTVKLSDEGLLKSCKVRCRSVGVSCEVVFQGVAAPMICWFVALPTITTSLQINWCDKIKLFVDECSLFAGVYQMSQQHLTVFHNAAFPYESLSISRMNENSFIHLHVCCTARGCSLYAIHWTDMYPLLNAYTAIVGLKSNRVSWNHDLFFVSGK